MVGLVTSGLLSLATGAHAVELGDGVAPVGTALRSEHHTLLELQLTADIPGGIRTAPLRKDHHQQSTATLVAAQDDRRTVAIAWSHNTLMDEGPDGARTRTLPGVGIPFQVTLSPTGPTVAPAETSDEARQIAADGADLFTLLPAVRRMLGDHDWQLGDQRPAGPLLAGLVRDAPGTPTVDGTLTLAALAPCGTSRCATFTVVVTLTSTGLLPDGTPASMAALLEGTLTVDVPSGLTRRLSVTGPVTLRGTTTRLGTSVPFEGRGTFTSDTRLTPVP